LEDELVGKNVAKYDIKRRGRKYVSRDEEWVVVILW